ncbi:hypothetical protein OPQ81_011786 [Rhizoctonia solani]|nr:hypothetical protein OPQ81_011786 [Rhizoctonia solani]
MNSHQSTILTLLFFATVTLAHGGEEEALTSVDATTPGTNIGSEMMMMTPYFHWMANADALFFKAWVPRTPGALVGACIGLFLLAIFERFLGGAKGLLEAWWRRQQASSATRALVTPDNVSVHSHSKSIESGRDYLMGANTSPPHCTLRANERFSPWGDPSCPEFDWLLPNAFYHDIQCCVLD